MNRGKRILPAALTAFLLLSASSCGADRTEIVPSPAFQSAAKPVPSSPPAPVRSNAPEGAADKEETVYVQADASGAPRMVTVETVLNYSGEDGSVRDLSRLSDIKNTEGDEDFSLDENGALLWEDHGERIRYEGVSQEELPVTVTVTYYLDGVRTDPADLAGQSGHVRIRFDYENNTAQTVTVTHADLSEDDDGPPDEEDGQSGGEPARKGPVRETVTTPIPFLAISLALLPEDVFTNVRVTNGRLMTMGGQSIAMGCALPGLDRALSLRDWAFTEDADIPAYVEIDADVVDFSLDFTATILSNGLLEDLDPEDLDDIEKLSDGMDKLAEAVEEIADGARELSDGAGELDDGAGEFASYVSQLADGIWQVYFGAEGLRSGLSALNDQTAPLRDASDVLDTAVQRLQAALDGAEAEGLTTTAQLLEELIADIDAFQEALAGLAGYTAWVPEAAAAADAYLAGLDLDISGALAELDLPEEQWQQVVEAVNGSLSGVQGSIDEARGYLAALMTAPEEPSLAVDTEAIAQAADALRAEAENALANADQLPATPQEAVDQLSALAGGLSTLCGAIDQLASGAASLSDGAYALGTGGSALEEAVWTLSDGTSALAEGADALADGLEEFRNEGIEELTDIADEHLVTLITQLRALREADLAYENFGGIAPGRTGSVRFIVETDAIE